MLLVLYPAEPVLAVAWSPAHPDLVATGGQDDKAFVWRVSEAVGSMPRSAQSWQHADAAAAAAACILLYWALHTHTPALLRLLLA